MKSIKELYREHQGKVSDKWELYLREYDRLFAPYRDRPVRLLEIGIQNGGSLEIWGRYFPKAEKIVGCDINPDCAKLVYDDARIAVVVGDANTDESQAAILQQSGNFDLIIDDGSHTSGDIVRAFARYFPHLQRGGLFIVEDLHCSYWKGFEGGLYHPYSSMAFFKRLADVINYEHWGVPKDRHQILKGVAENFSIDFPDKLLSEIHSIEFVNSMCVVRKLSSELNKLGARLIAGQEELVVIGHHPLAGQLPPSIEETGNSWSILDKSPDESFEQVSKSLHITTQELIDNRSLLSDRDGQIVSLNQAMAERDGQIAGLNQVVAERDGQILALSHAVAERDQQFATLLGSRSWRVTKPLRLLGQCARKGYHRVRLLSAVVQQGGGFGSTLMKTVCVIKKEGITGVRHRIRFALDKASYAHATSLNGGINQLPVYNRTNELPAHDNSVDIVVCVHNALEDVRRCLQSVFRTTLPPYRLIVVDDGSDVETREYLEHALVGQPAKLIRHETARGYTLAANAGLRASDADFVILLNSDTILSPRWIDRLICCAQADARIGMVGPLSNTASWQSIPHTFDQDGDWAENPLPQGWSLEAYATEVSRESARLYPRVGFLNGFCLLIKREMINDVGLFDEETFGRGYGEENDYCLRAAAKHWQLAVADDCYVFHAQSKSYSTERRKELVGLSDRALQAKHGAAHIHVGLLKTKQHLALEYIRLRFAQIPMLASQRTRLLHRHEGRRVLFLLPAGTAGGGGNIVLLECSTMRQLGIDAWVANLQTNRMLFERSHPQLDVPVLYLNTPAELVNYAKEFDAVIATLYLTVSWLQPLRTLDSPPRLGYYIQDFEPDFFPHDTAEYKQAFASYTDIPEICLTTKTRWNAEMVRRQVGCTATVVGPSFDIEKFHPSPNYAGQEDGLVRIVAMVRPSTPRRAPLMTMRVLEQIKNIFREKVKITIFGVDPAHPDYLKLGCNFEHEKLGELQMGAVRDILAYSDIFVDCSNFQAMGLTAMEAMASGVAVVGPINGGLSEIIQHEQSGLLVDTSNQQAIFEAVARLIRDTELRQSISRAGLNVVVHHPMVAAGRILDCLFPKTNSVIEDLS